MPADGLRLRHGSPGRLGIVLAVLAVAVPSLARAGSSAPRIDAPCSACRAVALALQDRIDQEPVRNHLDMRHRLDSSGQRYGKVIDYKVSELRAIELLEDLCPSLTDWVLVMVNSTHGRTQHWERTALASQPARLPELEEEAKQKKLRSFCGRILEDHEEELTSAIQQGKLERGKAVSWRDLPETADGTTSYNSVSAANSEAAARAAGIQGLPEVLHDQPPDDEL